MKSRDLVERIRARLAAWEVARGGPGPRYYSTKDLECLPSLSATDPIVTGLARSGANQDGPPGARLVQAANLELFERKLQELEASGWRTVSPIDLAEDGHTVRCWMLPARRRRRSS